MRIRGHAVQLDMATSRQEREAGSYLFFELAAGPPEESSEAPVEPELRPMVPDEIEDGANRLARTSPEAAPELLKEQGRAVSRA